MKKETFWEMFDSRNDAVKHTAIVNTLWGLFVALIIYFMLWDREEPMTSVIFTCLSLIQIFSSYLILIEHRKPVTLILVNVSSLVAVLYALVMPLMLIIIIQVSFGLLGIAAFIVSDSSPNDLPAFVNAATPTFTEIVFNPFIIAIFALCLIFLRSSFRSLYYFNTRKAWDFYHMNKLIKR